MNAEGVISIFGEDLRFCFGVRLGALQELIDMDLEFFQQCRIQQERDSIFRIDVLPSPDENLPRFLEHCIRIPGWIHLRKFFSDMIVLPLEDDVMHREPLMLVHPFIALEASAVVVIVADWRIGVYTRKRPDEIRM